MVELVWMCAIGGVCVVRVVARCVARNDVTARSTPPPALFEAEGIASEPEATVCERLLTAPTARIPRCSDAGALGGPAESGDHLQSRVQVGHILYDPMDIMCTP